MPETRDDANETDPDVFAGLADFEVEFFHDLVRAYAKLDLATRGFFFHRMKQVVRDAIALVRGEQSAARAFARKDRSIRN
jgi:hypothetical protein